MRNQDRFPPAFVLGMGQNGVLSAAGIIVGHTDLDDGSAVCVKTNGGVVVSMPAPNALIGEPEDDGDDQTE